MIENWSAAPVAVGWVEAAVSLARAGRVMAMERVEAAERAEVGAMAAARSRRRPTCDRDWRGGPHRSTCTSTALRQQSET